jgi:hypothetical protein
MQRDPSEEFACPIQNGDIPKDARATGGLMIIWSHQRSPNARIAMK